MRAQTDKARSFNPIDFERPLILSVDAAGGPRIAALNAVAETFGLSIGDLVADARAKVGMLQVHPADAAADQAALQRLALWAMRYAPTVSPWEEENGADGFFLDVTGAIHFFGSEERLLEDIERRLCRFGLPAQVAMAGTAGAAWALSRFHPSPVVAIRSGSEMEHLAAMPVEALRLLPNVCALLRKLGIKRIGSLIDKPRASLAARFPSELLERLDQMFGQLPEPLAAMAPPSVHQAQRQLSEPITTQEAIVAVATDLMEELASNLIRAGMGAKGLRLTLYRIDGEVTSVDLDLSIPTRDPLRVARLFSLKLERLVDAIDAGFGFETVSLAVTVAQRMQARQTDLVSISDSDEAEQCTDLIDTLKQRLGPRRVLQLKPVASHLPENAEGACVPLRSSLAWPAADHARLRPILLSRPEPTEVVAIVPEGLPKRFRWRGRIHNVIHAQGPERIACEWWKYRASRTTRDYYLVETGGNHRLWLVRDGLYERETGSPRWFVHGHFA